MKQTLLILTIIIGLTTLFTACGTAEKPTAKADKKNDWQQKLLDVRKEKDHYFKTGATSPMAGLKRITVKNDKETFVTETNETITFSDKKEDGARFSMAFNEGKWSWQSFDDLVSGKAGGKNLEPGSPLPGRTVFTVRRFTIVTYPSPEAITIVVFDPQRPVIKNFSHLLYFPPDRKYAVNAKLEKFETIETIKVLTTRNLVKNYHKYAKVRFELDGKTYYLTAFKFSLDKKAPGSKYLFIPFSDATCGEESYEVGRFLEIDEPENENFVLDFNRCFNPLCNYADVYNCPVPPLENHLEVKIEAGEKCYPKSEKSEG